MREQISRPKFAALAAVVAALAVMGLASAASAHTAPFDRFNNCPSTNPEVKKCLQAVTNSGSVVLGKKTVPIVNPVTLQGGLSEEFEKKNISSTGSLQPRPAPRWFRFRSLSRVDFRVWSTAKKSRISWSV